MHDVGAILVLVFAILRGIYLLFRWLFRSLKRLSAPGPTYTPVQSMTPPESTPAARLAAGTGLPAPMPPPPLQLAFPPPVVTREATTADFRTQEAALIADEDQSRRPQRQTASSQTVSPSPSPTPLFGTTSDLIRGLILQEVLGPPLARRRRQSDTDEIR